MHSAAVTAHWPLSSVMCSNYNINWPVHFLMLSFLITEVFLCDDYRPLFLVVRSSAAYGRQKWPNHFIRIYEWCIECSHADVLSHSWVLISHSHMNRGLENQKSTNHIAAKRPRVAIATGIQPLHYREGDVKGGNVYWYPVFHKILKLPKSVDQRRMSGRWDVSSPLQRASSTVTVWPRSQYCCCTAKSAAALDITHLPWLS